MKTFLPQLTVHHKYSMLHSTHQTISISNNDNNSNIDEIHMLFEFYKLYVNSNGNLMDVNQ